MLRLLEYKIGKEVVAFSTTRHGGVSVGNYSSFNINHYCGDEPQAIAANREQLCHHLAIDESHLVYPHQTHQTEIRHITESYFALSEQQRADFLEGVDAVSTDIPGICIGVSTADCIPILLFDRQHHAVAAVHAGWRGTVARIVEKTVIAMVENYDTDTSRLYAVIGPGISLENFEVGDEVYVAFEQNGFDMNEIAQKFPTTDEGQSAIVNSKLSNRKWRWHLDLPECNRLQLLNTGVQEENISLSGICTYDCHSDFFSARRLGINSGRIFTGIMMK